MVLNIIIDQNHSFIDRRGLRELIAYLEETCWLVRGVDEEVVPEGRFLLCFHWSQTANWLRTFLSSAHLFRSTKDARPIGAQYKDMEFVMQ